MVVFAGVRFGEKLSRSLGRFLTDPRAQDARMKNIFRPEARNETLVARFGEARLVCTLQGRIELRDGSRSDRIEAREWVSMFLHDVAVREN